MIQTELDIIEQLIEIHYTHEAWHGNMSKKSASDYFSTLMERGNLLISFDGEKVTGYAEAWKLSYAKFGYYMLSEYFDINKLSTVSGEVCFIANICILPEYRKTGVIKDLLKQAREYGSDCLYFAGRSTLKSRKPFYKALNLRRDRDGF